MRKFIHALLGLLAASTLLFSEAAQSRDMKLTMYADGHSCPGDCDAHVVVNPEDNGSRFAFAPDSSRSAPADCRNGQQCRICFGEADDSCMQALYRGGGPPAGTFDFTPAFYDATCGRTDIPAALARKCAELDRAVQSRDGGVSYADRINCFKEPTNPRCVEVMARAEADKAADQPKRQQCLALGEGPYNAQQPSAEKRSLSCNYSQERRGGPNSRGVTWRVLLPAACPSGSFVGKDGLDCCSESARFAAAIKPECSRFFLRP